MTDDELYREAFNLHERAEAAAMEAMVSVLRAGGVDALACLCDTSWRWETRSWMSGSIIDQANEELDAKLESMVAA
jgi:hypothetical protein